MTAPQDDVTTDPLSIIAALREERDAALAREAALAEVLDVINRSPGDPAPVFEAILGRAMRLCEAAFGELHTFDGQRFKPAATQGLPPAYAEIRLNTPRTNAPGTGGRRFRDGADLLHIVDLKAEEIYRSGNADRRALVDLGGARSVLAVALRNGDLLLGNLMVYRQEVRPFTDRQVALLRSFAAQAVIAMENARLLSDLHQRTGDLRESLEYQTATSDVLKVISRSGFDLEPVLSMVAETAARLCAADQAAIFRRDGELAQLVTNFGFPPEYEATLKNMGPHPFNPNSPGVGHRAVAESRMVHIHDVAAVTGYSETAVRLGKQRTSLGVPLLREGEPVGVIVLARQHVEPFTERQIQLVRTFADQAVIAIENARLLTEQQEALEQQTATAEVLQVINNSPGELAPVFDAMLDKALELCGAAFGVLWTYDGERVHAAALRGVPPAFAEFLTQSPHPVGLDNAHGRLLGGEPMVHISDVADDDAYLSGDPIRRTLVEVGGGRTLLAVSLRKDDAFLGDFVIYRKEVRPFSDKQIALLKNFAAQAVIAMENARLITEQREALEQQTATAEVLRVINASPGDLPPVFDAVLEKALQLCAAALGLLLTYDGERFHLAAERGVPAAYLEFRENNATVEPHGGGAARVLETRRPVQTLDVREGEGYRTGNPVSRAFVELTGGRTLLGVPLLKDGAVIGAILIYRQEVQAFSEKQVALLENFAAQAVIAMENARLIAEQREALEQQTATAEVLQVINASPGNLAPVFDTVLEKAIRLCESEFGIFNSYDGEYFHVVAARGISDGLAEYLRAPIRTHPGLALYRMVQGESVVHIADITDDDAYRSGDLGRRAVADLGGARSQLMVALRKDSTLLGAINVFRQEVRPFSDKQIALVENFAAQAVIAMENARLITEQREALEQQTATAEVLRVINASPGDLAPVFEAILDKAHSLCGADIGSLLIYDGTFFHAAAAHGHPEQVDMFLRRPFRPNHFLQELLRGERLVHVRDFEAAAIDPAHDLTRGTIQGTNVRTSLWVPLRKDGTLLGCISAFRTEVRLFTEKEIALLENFAAQAVIAMENARLLSELRARTDELGQRQTELRVTFENMGDGVALFDGTPRLVAWNRKFQEMLEVPDEVLAERRTFAEYVRYLAERGEYGAAADPDEQIRRLAENAGHHHADERTRPDGRVIEIRHNPVPSGGFVLIYADITERKRNEAEIRAARDAAEAASRTIDSAYRDLKTAQASLIQAEKMASLGQLTAGIAHEIKNPLNFVNNFAILSVELLAELKEIIAKALVSFDDDLRADAEEVVGTLTGNLEKITEHGRRADGIVKSMLEHSRGESGERRTVDLNALIDEALKLAYHGARAQDQSFNITLERDFGSDVAPIELAPQDMTRVFLNLFSNGFYAAGRRAQGGSDPDFAPVLKVTTRSLGEAIEVRVRDNGAGIPADIKDKLFQPFFTTKPTGEGTGLGLSISYDIVTQQHGGTITVESEPNSFTEFTVTIPRSRSRAG